MQLTITWLKILGASTYGWTPQGQKLGVSGHRGHQWIDAYVYGSACICVIIIIIIIIILDCLQLTFTVKILTGVLWKRGLLRLDQIIYIRNCRSLIIGS